MVFKRGRVYYYKFLWKGMPVFKSTRQGSKRVAEQIEAAHRTALAKGEVGISEKKQSPTTFAVLCERFLSWADTNKRSDTSKFYNDMVRSLQRYHPLNRLTIDQIDETIVDRFVEW